MDPASRSSEPGPGPGSPKNAGYLPGPGPGTPVGRYPYQG